MTRSLNYHANLHILSILAAMLGCNFHRLELGTRDLLSNTTIKLAYDLGCSTISLSHKLLLTAWLGLGIHHDPQIV